MRKIEKIIEQVLVHLGPIVADQLAGIITEENFLENLAAKINLTDVAKTVETWVDKYRLWKADRIERRRAYKLMLRQKEYDFINNNKDADTAKMYIAKLKWKVIKLAILTIGFIVSVYVGPSVAIVYVQQQLNM